MLPLIIDDRIYDCRFTSSFDCTAAAPAPAPGTGLGLGAGSRQGSVAVYLTERLVPGAAGGLLIAFGLGYVCCQPASGSDPLSADLNRPVIRITVCLTRVGKHVCSLVFSRWLVQLHSSIFSARTQKRSPASRGGAAISINLHNPVKAPESSVLSVP